MKRFGFNEDVQRVAVAICSSRLRRLVDFMSAVTRFSLVFQLKTSAAERGLEARKNTLRRKIREQMGTPVVNCFGTPPIGLEAVRIDWFGFYHQSHAVACGSFEYHRANIV